MLTGGSFHETGFAIDRGQVGGVGCYSSYFHCTDAGFVLGVCGCIKSF